MIADYLRLMGFIALGAAIVAVGLELAYRVVYRDEESWRKEDDERI